MSKSPIEDERKFLLGIRDLLRREREVEKREAYEDRVRARVLDVTEDLVTFGCKFPMFREGDIIGYITQEGDVKPIGSVLAEGTVITVGTNREIGLEEGQLIDLCKGEVLVGYDLQISLIDRILNDELDDLERDAVLCLFGGGNTGSERISLSDKLDSTGKIELDESQIEAVERILGLEDRELLIVVGPPGTGKTRVIAKAALELRKRGERVLITSHTNRAVDNALEALPVEISLRVGRPEKVLKGIRPYLLSYKARTALGSRLEQIESQISKLRKEIKGLHGLAEEWKRVSKEKYNELKGTIKGKIKRIRDLYKERNKMLVDESKKLVEKAGIMGSTLIKSNMPPLHLERFDTVLIDECSQASITLALLGMIKARKWVLVGDHKQLLPVFKSIRDKRLVEKLSAFCLMRKFYGKGEVWLRKHYRSNSRIINFSCRYVYNGMISPVKECDGIKLEIRNYPREMEFLNPDIPAVFLDVRGEDFVEGRSRANRAEVEAVVRIARTLKRLGIRSERMGIITPYKAQRNRIAEELKDEKLEVNTVDSFQGREKDVIIFSITSTGNMDFVSDENRLNVAFTRARKKLIVVGNAESMEKMSGGLLYNYLMYVRNLNGFFKWQMR